MSPIATADPSPAPPAALAPVAAVVVIWVVIWVVILIVVAPMVDRLHFRLSVEFIENAAFGPWNTGHCIDRPNRACKGRCPCKAKHCRQERSPIHIKPPKVGNKRTALRYERVRRAVKFKDSPAAVAHGESYQRRKGR